MATHSRTYIRQYVVIDRELEIRTLNKNATSHLLYEVGKRVDLSRVPHRFTDNGELILILGGVEHPLAKDSYHLDVATETITT